MFFAGTEIDRTDVLAHSPEADHPACQAGRLLEVVFRACRDLAVHDHLGRPPAEHPRETSEQIGAAVIVLVLVRHLDGDTERATAWNHADLPQWVGARRVMRDKGMAGFVVGHDLALLGVRQAGTSHSEQDLVERLVEVRLQDLLAIATSRCQCGFIHEVGEIGPGKTCGRTCDVLKVHLALERDAAGVDGKDRHPAALVRQADRYLPVEPSRSQKRGIEHIRPVGGGHDDDFLVGFKAVHLDEQLIERLFALIVGPTQSREPLPPDRIHLIDEDDRRCGSLCLVEQVTDSTRADADEHLHELRGRDAEEGHARFASHGPGGQGLPGARRSYQQHATGEPGAKRVVFRRVPQEVDDLHQLLLCLVLSSNIGECDLRSLRIVLPGLAPSEPEDVLLPSRHLPPEQDEQANEQQEWQEAEEDIEPDRPGGCAALDLDASLLKRCKEVRVVDSLGKRGLDLFGDLDIGRVLWGVGIDLLCLGVPLHRLLELDCDFRLGEGGAGDVVSLDLLCDGGIADFGRAIVILVAEELPDVPADEGDNQGRNNPGGNARVPALRFGWSSPALRIRLPRPVPVRTHEWKLGLLGIRL